MTDPVCLRVIVADPDVAVRTELTAWLRSQGDDAQATSRVSELRDALRGEVCDVVVVDTELTSGSAEAIVTRVRRSQPETDVVLLARRGTVSDAVDAVKAGATDFLVKPVDVGLLSRSLARTRERVTLSRALASARQELATQLLGPVMIGRAANMRRLRERTERCARSDATVAVVGESGTGKEIVARMLHAGSPRADGPFVALNCAAFPETLLEAELFGHERGAFTGAHKRRRGRFQAASGGTLFLDEVAEMSLSAQAKLLRVLQEGVVQPVGSDDEVQVDVRVISATHRSLKDRVEAGAFREDLLYRLKVLELRVPPLRDRLSDLPLLVEHFLARLSGGRPVPTLTSQAWAALMRYSYPGNVRELEHALQHAMVLCDGHLIGMDHLPESIVGEGPPEGFADEGDVTFPSLATAHKAWEHDYLVHALHLTEGKRARAADLLGISRKSLWEKLKVHGLADHLRTPAGPKDTER